MVASRGITGRLSRLNRDTAPHLLECVLNIGRVSAQTLIARALAWWWGVDVGRGCNFYGLPLFRRLPETRIEIGANCEFRSSYSSNLIGINRPCIVSTLRPDANLQIGRGCGFSGTVIGCATRISIGDRVMCGANVTITDTDWHAIHWQDRASGKPGPADPVKIGDDVWLGMNVVVLKGVEIGQGTVVGAGSIVTRSLPAGVIAAGHPATVIRRLSGAEESEAAHNAAR